MEKAKFLFKNKRFPCSRYCTNRELHRYRSCIVSADGCRRNYVMALKDLKPAVTKPWLVAIAGFMWTGVGVILCRLAYHWFSAAHTGVAAILGLLGALMALTAYHFGFSKIAQRNMKRLCLLKEKPCVFAFQTWKGYLIIGFMILLGAILRSSPIPKPYLAVVYSTIGGAIFLSSFHYYRLLWRLAAQKNP